MLANSHINKLCLVATFQLRQIGLMRSLSPHFLRLVIQTLVTSSYSNSLLTGACHTLRVSSNYLRPKVKPSNSLGNDFEKNGEND